MNKGGGNFGKGKNDKSKLSKNPIMRYWDKQKQKLKEK